MSQNGSLALSDALFRLVNRLHDAVRRAPCDGRAALVDDLYRAELSISHAAIDIRYCAGNIALDKDTTQRLELLAKQLSSIDQRVFSGYRTSFFATLAVHVSEFARSAIDGHMTRLMTATSEMSAFINAQPWPMRPERTDPSDKRDMKSQYDSGYGRPDPLRGPGGRPEKVLRNPRLFAIDQSLGIQTASFGRWTGGAARMRDLSLTRHCVMACGMTSKLPFGRNRLGSPLAVNADRSVRRLLANR